MDVCDPGQDMKNIRKLVLVHTGKKIRLSRDRVCEIFRSADAGKLPLPPLGITKDKRYLIDSKSPLTQNDYEVLFSSTSVQSELKRLARKVGLINVDKTKGELKSAIGRRLHGMKVREPVVLVGGARATKSEPTNSAVVNDTMNANTNTNMNVKRNITNTNVNVKRNITNANTRRNNTPVPTTRRNNTPVPTLNKQYKRQVTNALVRRRSEQIRKRMSGTAVMSVNRPAPAPTPAQTPAPAPAPTPTPTPTPAPTPTPTPTPRRSFFGGLFGGSKKPNNKPTPAPAPTPSNNSATKLKTLQNELEKRNKLIQNTKNEAEKNKAEALKKVEEEKNAALKEANAAKNKAVEEVRLAEQAAAQAATAEERAAAAENLKTARESIQQAETNKEAAIAKAASAKNLANKKLEITKLAANAGVNFTNKINAINANTNLNTIRREIQNAKNVKNKNLKNKRQGQLSNLLNSSNALNNQDKVTYLNRFEKGENFNSLMNTVRANLKSKSNAALKTKQRQQLNTLMTNSGFNNTEKNSYIRTFNGGENFNSIMNSIQKKVRANSNAKLANAQERAANANALRANLNAAKTNLEAERTSAQSRINQAAAEAKAAERAAANAESAEERAKAAQNLQNAKNKLNEVQGRANQAELNLKKAANNAQAKRVRMMEKLINDSPHLANTNKIAYMRRFSEGEKIKDLAEEIRSKLAANQQRALNNVKAQANANKQKALNNAKIQANAKAAEMAANANALRANLNAAKTNLESERASAQIKINEAAAEAKAAERAAANAESEEERAKAAQNLRNAKNKLNEVQGRANQAEMNLKKATNNAQAKRVRMMEKLINDSSHLTNTNKIAYMRRFSEGEKIKDLADEIRSKLNANQQRARNNAKAQANANKQKALNNAKAQANANRQKALNNAEAARKAEENANRIAKEEANKKAANNAEAARKAKENANAKAKEEANKKAANNAEAARKAKENANAKAMKNKRQENLSVLLNSSNALNNLDKVKYLNQFEKGANYNALVNTVKMNIKNKTNKKAKEEANAKKAVNDKTTNIAGRFRNKLKQGVATRKAQNEANAKKAKREEILRNTEKYKTNAQIKTMRGKIMNPFRGVEFMNQIALNAKKRIENIKSSEKNEANATAMMEKLNKNAKIQGNKNRTTLLKLLESTKTNKKEADEYVNAFEKGRQTFKEIKENIIMKAKRNAFGRKLNSKPVATENNDAEMKASATFNDLNVAPKRNALMEKAKKEVARVGGRIGKWDPVIKGITTVNAATNLEKKLNDKIKLRDEIQRSVIGPIKKAGHRAKVMQLDNNVNQRRKIFEQQLDDLARNAKKKEISKYITGLNIPAENKSRYVKQMNKPGANLDMIQASANKQVNDQKIANASRSLVANAIGRVKNKSYENAKAMGGVMRNNPLSETSPKPSFRAAVQKNKAKKLTNAVKAAAKIANNRAKLEKATGANRVELARKQKADMNRNRGEKATAAASLMINKAAVRKAAERAANSAKAKLARNALAQAPVSRQERRYKAGGNLNMLKKLKKEIGKDRKLSPKQVDAEARRRLAKMRV